MKGIGVGILVWVLVAFSSPYGSGAGAGLFLGMLATWLVWRLDALNGRLRHLEAQAPQAVEIPIGVAHSADAKPMPMPPPAPPAAPKPQRAAPSVAKAAATMAVAPAAPPRPPLIRMDDLEAFLAGRLLAVVGGLALVIGGIFFLGLAFSRGWIGPEARVALALVAGALFFGFGTWLLLRPGNRSREVLAHVLVAVGLAVISLGFFSATRLYGFVAPELGVGGSLLAAGVAAVIAIRARSQLVAGFGLVAVLAAPPVMGASATLLTIVFLGTALAGTTAISLFVSWRWLPPVAYLLAAPQLISYLTGDPNLAIAFVALGVFWVLNALSAAGEEVLRPSQRLTATSATLMVANAAFAVWAGFGLLDGALEPWRGLYLVVVAAIHLGLGLCFLMRNGERHPFGMLVFGSGVAALTLAVPVQLGASWVPMAWAAEAVALAWVYAQRNHLYAGAVAAVLGTLALGHLLTFEYPFGPLATGPGADVMPFINAAGGALVFVTAASGVAILLLPRTPERIGIAAVMGIVIALVLPGELTGAWLIAGYGLLAAGPLLVERRWVKVPLLREVASLKDGAAWLVAMSERGLYVTFGLAALIGLTLVVRDHLTFDRFVTGLAPFAFFANSPFRDDGTIVAGIVAATALLIAFGADDRRYRWIGCVAAAMAVAYLIPFELGGAWAVVAWLGLALVLQLVGSQWQSERGERRWVVYGFAVAAAVELLVLAPPTRLVVSFYPNPEAALLNGGVLAVAAFAAALAVRALLAPRDRDARISALIAAAAGVYLLSIGMVDLFQRRLTGSVPIDEPAKQAQVALSVMWAVLGVIGFVIGLVRKSTRARLFGLGLLGIVTVKVFVVDLAALDVAYRVLSFVALGLLLLGAAYLASRFQPRKAPS